MSNLMAAGEEQIVSSTAQQTHADPLRGAQSAGRSAGVLIKDGRVVNDDEMFDADVYVKDGLIAQVGPNLSVPPGTRVIEAKGKLVMPGGIDTHTHMQLPFMGTFAVDDFYSGTRAALAGGTTMIMDFALPSKGESLLEGFHKWRAWADPKVCCDYALHVGVTWWGPKVEAEMAELASSHGVNSFKMFMAYKDTWQLDDTDLMSAFAACKKIGALAQVHAENGDVIKENSKKLLEKGITGPEGHELSRPEEVEAEATNRACVLANQTGTSLYVCTVSCEGSGKVISEGRLRGQSIFAETTPAYLAVDGSNHDARCWRHAASHVTSPPIRRHVGENVLTELLQAGDLQTTGTDNCTFSSSQKALGKDDFTKIPNGVNGVEDRMSVIWEKGVHQGKMDACRFVAVTSTNAAKIFNIYPQKGRIAVGSDADIVVWNPHATRVISAQTHHQAVDFNIFEGMTVHGVADYVLTRGAVAVVEGRMTAATAGWGRYVETEPFCPAVYARTPARDAAKKWEKVEREPYAGPVIDLSALRAEPAATRAQARPMHQSTFSVSENSSVGNSPKRLSVKVNQPPGGKTAGNFW